MSELRQLTSEKERQFLVRNAHGNALEIGSYDGGSAISLASVCKSVLCVDCFYNYGRDGITPSLSAFLDSTDSFGNIHLLYSTANFALPLLKDDSFDFIHIDGDHTEPQVYFDIQNAMRLLKQNGRIALHDVGRYPEVDQQARYLRSFFYQFKIVEAMMIVSNFPVIGI